MAVPDEFFDVLIIGAGISGIDAAYRINEQNPHLRYAMLERRERLGGTWDLFRYPGVRSDSDIFTLSFPFEPWSHEHAIADGDQIRQYLADTAAKHHIAEHIRFNTYVRSADWDSATDTWTVRGEQDGADRTYRCRFLYCATGYYNYDHPYTPDFRGIGELLRAGGASAALAGVARLRRQAGCGDRQRSDGDQPDPGADGEGRPCDDAAAFTELSVLVTPG